MIDFNKATQSLKNQASKMGAADKTGLSSLGASRARSYLGGQKSKYMSEMMSQVKHSSLIKGALQNVFDMGGLGMDADLQTILSNTPDLVRSNLFQVYFDTPQVLQEFNEDFQNLKYFCKGISVPFYTFTESNMNYNLVKRSIATGVDKDPVTATFNIPTSNVVLKAMRAWYEAIRNSETNHFNFKNEYETNIVITIYNRNAGEVFSAAMIGAYPANISGLDLDFESSDTFANLSVTFNFDSLSYKVEDVNTFII